MRKLLLSTCIAVIVLLNKGECRGDHPTLGFGSGIAGPAITMPATTLPKGQGGVALRVEYLKFDTFSDADLARYAGESEGTEVHSVDYLVSPSVSAGYGVTDDFTIGLRLPYLIRSGIRAGHVHDGEAEVDDHGDADGVGDLVLLGQYRFYKGKQGGPEAALLLGLKMPTGATTVRDREGELFEVEHQPGSGSWDPLLGVAGSRRLGALSIDANVLYTFATSGARSTNLGDRFYYNLAASYRIGEETGGHHEESEHHHDESGGGHQHAEHGHPEWHLILELNGEWQEKQKIAGEIDGNSGGKLIYLSPGARFCGAGGWAVSLSVGVPVYQEQNGIQHETDLRTVASVSMGF